MPRATAIALVGMVGLHLTGCSDSEQAVTTAKAVVDPASGAVTLPFDQYWPTSADTADLGYALNLAVSRCMESHGFRYPPVKPLASPALSSWSRFGVWRLEDARRYGYDRPVPDATADSLPQLTGPAAEQEEQCRSGQEAKKLKLGYYYRPDVMKQYRFMDLPAAATTEPGKAVLADWRSCLSTAKVPLPPEPAPGAPVEWVSPELETATPEQRITAAVADVTCKQEVNLVQRLADLEAGAQQAVIEEHRDEMEAFRRIWLPMRENAREIISSYRG